MIFGVIHIVSPVASGGGGNFLVSPETGPMIWTLIAFGVTLWILSKFAFPRIAEALDRRQKMIEDSIAMAEQTSAEAKALLEQYRQQLASARGEADGIVARARKTGESQQAHVLEQARERSEEILAEAQREILAETRRAIMDLRSEVADMTVLATEKVTRKSLDSADQKRIVEEALAELDFSALAAGKEGR